MMSPRSHGLGGSPHPTYHTLAPLISHATPQTVQHPYEVGFTNPFHR